MTSVSKEQLATENVDQDVDTGCGLTPACQPKWLQKCADAKVFLVVLTAFGVVQGKKYNLHSFDLLYRVQEYSHV